MSFKIEELSGSLIKSGKFAEAIVPFFRELDEAHGNGVITHNEFLALQQDFCWLLLKPDVQKAQSLGTRMMYLAIRIPGKVPNENIKLVDTDEAN
jgi:hypothetical protein